MPLKKWLVDNNGLIDSVNKTITTLAIVIGAPWAAFLYLSAETKYGAEHYPALQVMLKPTVAEYKDKKKLLNVAVNLKNIGSTKLFVDSKKGLLLRVYKIVDVAKTVGHVDWLGMEMVVESSNILFGYDEGSYVIKPDVEYHEVDSVYVDDDTHYLIRVTCAVSPKGDCMKSGPEEIVEYCVVSTYKADITK
ncbi:MAG TPA: hypothetical protein VHY91_20460 [Pirellulales bacterium]|jgi:hypothetical protein|nr:hypothetical protein [Pirellulales bacterium]